MASSIPRLKDFPGLWRVNGFNNIKIYEKSAPRIFVSLSQIKEEGSQSSLYNGQITGQQIWLNRPLSNLSDLLIGSCWRGGKEGGGVRVNRLPPMERKFLVDTAQTRIVRLGDQIELNGNVYRSVLPSGAIEFKKHFLSLKNSLYAVVPVLNDSQTKFLVVSCYELYRAYFGVSSRFLNNIAVNNLDKYMYWNDPWLHVKTTLSRLEQFVAYRGNCSSYGKLWFDTPSSYIKKLKLTNDVVDKTQEQPLVIKSIFPFSGRTILTVAGKAFKNINEHGNQIWCVFAANLLKCSRESEFTPLIESDAYTDSPLPWQDEVIDSPPLGNDPFEDELDDTDEPPNARGKSVAILESSNFFEAMNGLRFIHKLTGNSLDPVYQNELGEEVGSSSSDEVEKRGEGEKCIPQKSEFDTYTGNVERELSSFIKMIISLRQKLLKYGWVVKTRSYRSTLVVESEIVTTFLKDKNTRRTWPLISTDDGDRLRQIVWVEIAINETQFFYLMEMELKESEKGRSTLCVVGTNLDYMEETDFKTFLTMTAVQNRWPRTSHKWKKEQAQKVADEYFSTFQHIGLSHLSLADKDSSCDERVAHQWSSQIETSLLKLFDHE